MYNAELHLEINTSKKMSICDKKIGIIDEHKISTFLMPLPGSLPPYPLEEHPRGIIVW
jgi:hypothetical protein